MAVLVLSVAAASAQEREPALTTSKKLILMPGSNSISARVPAPACPPGLYFLVRQLVATPEVIDGQTAVEVMGLPYWAVSATVYQLRGKTAIQSALAAHGRGPTVAQVAMEGGQFAGGSVLVTAILLGGGTNSRQFEWNVHISGVCGVPFVQP